MKLDIAATRKRYEDCLLNDVVPFWVEHCQDR